MTCYHPLSAFVGPVGVTGARATVWREKDSDGGVSRALPCGKCVGCCLDRSREWSVRCMLESSQHKENCFVTLTFDDAKRPNAVLNVEDWQLFMKRLRKAHGPDIRFFASGEYGKFGRPHYHGLLFGFDFDDKIPWKKTPAGSVISRSPKLEALWPFGYSSVGEVSFESACYVARYVMKKQTQDINFKVFKDEETRHKMWADKVTGEVKLAEFILMSRRPGIGKTWFENFYSDVYPQDKVRLIDGMAIKPPRYFDNLLDKMNPALLDDLKQKRQTQVVFNDMFRLMAREEFKKSSTKSLRRTLE